MCQHFCHITCQHICQIRCQNRCQIRRQKICKDKCQVKCQSICQKECQVICQNICWRRCQKNVSGQMPEYRSDRMTNKMPDGISSVATWFRIKNTTFNEIFPRVPPSGPSRAVRAPSLRSGSWSRRPSPGRPIQRLRRKTKNRKP